MLLLFMFNRDDHNTDEKKTNKNKKERTTYSLYHYKGRNSLKRVEKEKKNIFCCSFFILYDVIVDRAY